jgi:DNA repair protein RecN (Recombination protein N)
LLIELTVRELALVSSATARFGSGLNLLTGETGSGKSLIVDALGLTLGARASTDQVRAGADKAIVESLFTDAAGRVPEGDLVLTREVGRRSIARINGRPVSPGQLRELGRELVGIHGQHEHQALLDTDAQLRLLDDFGGAGAARDAVADAHREWVEAGARLAELERLRARGQKEQEYLRWQLDELDQAGLVAGEDVELAAQRGALRHAARLGELTGGSLEALRSEEGLPVVASNLRAAAELDPRLTQLSERVAALEEEVADLGAGLRRYADELDADPGRLEVLEARLAVLEGIKRKYGGGVETAIAERDRLRAQLEQVHDLEGGIEQAAAAVAAARTELERKAEELTAIRTRGAGELAGAVSSELAGLRLEGARFEIRLLARTDISVEGAETGEMMFSANPGEPLAPLARVASGGELARVMLAIKTAGSEAERLPTLIFD